MRFPVASAVCRRSWSNESSSRTEGCSFVARALSTLVKNSRLANLSFSRALATQQQRRRLQSFQQHSTAATMVDSAVHSCPSIVVGGRGGTIGSASGTGARRPPTATPAAAAVPPPAYADLRTLFVASAIPMVGFGFMDQFVLIQAGGYIDATLGVSLGLATMTAAAAGQVVSDVSGVVFGGALERFLTRMSLIQAPTLTTAQRQLPICRNVSMAGAVLGVIAGCALGATTLLLVDLEARNRIERAARLRDIVNDMIAPTALNAFQCKSCTVYVVSTKDLTLPAEKATAALALDDKQQTHHKAVLKAIADADSDAVQQCADSGVVAVAEERRVLYAPVVKIDGDSGGTNHVMAVVAFRYGGAADGFNDEDVVTARVMARHIAIFMDRLVD